MYQPLKLTVQLIQISMIRSLGRNQARFVKPFRFLRNFSNDSSSSDSEKDSNDHNLQKGNQKDTSGSDLSFFQGGSSFDNVQNPISIKNSRSRIHSLNLDEVDVPWVDDWYRTKQGFARINLLAEKTDLSVDQVQSLCPSAFSIS